MLESYGYVYIWFDKKRKMFYIGCHWGIWISEIKAFKDGYICSSHRMRQAYKRRPETFKRKILAVITTNRRDMFMEEQRWLYMIPDNQLGNKYYNYQKEVWHWTLNPNKKLQSWIKGKTYEEAYGDKAQQVKQKISNNHHSKKTDYINCRKNIKLSEETKQKITDSLINYFANNPHPKHTKETKQKISQAHKGKKITKETKQKLREINLGKKHTEETKKKISQNNGLGFKGKRHTNESKEIMRQIHLGKTHSEETKQKLSLSRIGILKSEETKHKMSVARIGIKLSEDHKNKLSLIKINKVMARDKLTQTKLGYIDRDHPKLLSGEWEMYNIPPSTKGKLWWNNGIKNIRAITPPGPDWLRGKLNEKSRSIST